MCSYMQLGAVVSRWTIFRHSILLAASYSHNLGDTTIAVGMRFNKSLYRRYCPLEWRLPELSSE